MAASDLHPLYNKVVIQRVEAEEKIGGIFIPEMAREKTQIGTVLAVGDGYYDNGTWVECKTRPGDTVLFGKYSGTEFNYEHNTYFAIAEQEIICVIRKDSESGSLDLDEIPF